MVQFVLCLHRSLQFFDADIWNVQSNKCKSFGFEWTKHQRDAKRKGKWNSDFASIKHLIALFVIITDKLKKSRSYIHLNILNCTASVPLSFYFVWYHKTDYFKLKKGPYSTYATRSRNLSLSVLILHCTKLNLFNIKTLGLRYKGNIFKKKKGELTS